MTTFNPNQEGHYQVLREMLLEARTERNWLQRDVAERLQKTQAFISKYELGERNLDFVEVLHLLEIFEISEESFLAAYRARVIAWNSGTQAAVLRQVEERKAKNERAQTEIVRVMREHGISHDDLLRMKLLSKKKNTPK